MMEAYCQERDRIQRELETCQDVKAAADCLCAALERIRLKRGEAARDRRSRAQADRLFETARQALRCMMAVTEAEVSLREETKHIRTGREKCMAMLPAIYIGVGAALTVWLILVGERGQAVLSVLLTALGWLQSQLNARKMPTLVARTRPDSHELMRLMDRLMEAVESALEDLERESEQALLPVEQPRLTGDVLEPVQMLLEAAQTHDGDYALKAVPRLTAALMEQGIEAKDYVPDNEEYFDLFPGTEPGLTIRPALFKDGRLLVRGQATESME